MIFLVDQYVFPDHQRMNPNLVNSGIPKNPRAQCVLGYPSGRGGSARGARVQDSWGRRRLHQPCTVGGTLRMTLLCWSLRSVAQGWREGLLASVYVSHAFASPAADIAAPDELALAPLHVPDHVRVVAAATAKEVAAVRAL